MSRSNIELVETGISSKRLLRGSEDGSNHKPSILKHKSPAEEAGQQQGGDGSAGASALQLEVLDCAEDHEEADTVPVSSFVVLPTNPWYMYWWFLTVFMACLTGWTEPFKACFLPLPGLPPFDDFWAIVSYFAFVVFFLDMALRFCLAFIDRKQGVLVTDHRTVALHYLRGMFFVDFVATFPFEECVLTGAGVNWTDSTTGRWISLLKFLHLLRLYRLFDMFAYLETNMTIAQIHLMLVRNYAYIVYITHWAACFLYFIAAQAGFGQGSWVGRAYTDRLVGQGLAVRYIYSLYFSIATFSSMGDGDFYAVSTAESLFVICYLMLDMLVLAYITGTITVLVVKSDKRAKVFRIRVRNLEQYCNINDIPEELLDSMHEHLDLHYDTEQVSDAQVLARFPATMQRRVRRHLYLGLFHECYLFTGCSHKFMDTVMLATKLELFMPQVQIIAAGDVVSELFIIMSGDVEVQRAVNLGKARARMPEFDGNVSMTSGKSDAAAMVVDPDAPPLNPGVPTASQHYYLGPASPFGEVSFLTEMPSPDDVWSTSICRVLVLPRAAYNGLAMQFPQQMRKLLHNLQQHAEEVTRQEIIQAALAYELSEAQRFQIARHLIMAQVPLNDFSVRDDDEEDDTVPLLGVKANLSVSQQVSLEHLKEVQKVVWQFCVKIEQQDTNDFLSAASCGKLAAVQRALGQGISADSCDYDRRTALMMSCRMGHEEVVRALLDAGADAGARDNFGTSAIFEACTAGHDNLIAILLEAGARIQMDSILLAAKMCDCVSEGNLALLKRLLTAGAAPDAADYDKRCPLHISAAMGNLTAVKLMVEHGKATVAFQDRWGNTPMDEALRVGAQEVVAYLKPLIGDQQYQAIFTKWKEHRTQRFLHACFTGDVENIKFMLQHSKPPTILAGILIASSKGHTALLQALLAWGGIPMLRQGLGRCMLEEAVADGNDDVLDILTAGGLTFEHGATAALGSRFCSKAFKGDVDQLQRLMRVGVQPGIRDAKRGTALHAACAAGDARLEVVRLLVEDGGADVSLTDESGFTPHDVALHAGAKVVPEYLEWAALLAQPGRGGSSNSPPAAVAAAALERWGARATPPLPVRSAAVGSTGDHISGVAFGAGSGSDSAALQGPTAVSGQGKPPHVPPSMGPQTVPGLSAGVPIHLSGGLARDASSSSGAGQARGDQLRALLEEARGSLTLSGGGSGRNGGGQRSSAAHQPHGDDGAGGGGKVSSASPDVAAAAAAAAGGYCEAGSGLTSPRLASVTAASSSLSSDFSSTDSSPQISGRLHQPYSPDGSAPLHHSPDGSGRLHQHEQHSSDGSGALPHHKHHPHHGPHHQRDHQELVALLDEVGSKPPTRPPQVGAADGGADSGKLQNGSSGGGQPAATAAAGGAAASGGGGGGRSGGGASRPAPSLQRRRKKSKLHSVSFGDPVCQALIEAEHVEPS